MLHLFNIFHSSLVISVRLSKYIKSLYQTKKLSGLYFHTSCTCQNNHLELKLGMQLYVKLFFNQLSVGCYQ